MLSFFLHPPNENAIAYLFSLLFIIAFEDITDSYLETILVYVFSTSGVGDINDGYEHVFNETEKSNGAEDGIGNNYDKIVASDTDDNYNNGIHQTVRKDGNETFSENYDTVVTPDYESLDDARPPSIFSDVCEEIIDNQK